MIGNDLGLKGSVERNALGNPAANTSSSNISK